MPKPAPVPRGHAPSEGLAGCGIQDKQRQVAHVTPVGCPLLRHCGDISGLQGRQYASLRKEGERGVWLRGWRGPISEITLFEYMAHCEEALCGGGCPLSRMPRGKLRLAGGSHALDLRQRRRCAAWWRLKYDDRWSRQRTVHAHSLGPRGHRGPLAVGKGLHGGSSLEVLRAAFKVPTGPAVCSTAVGGRAL